MIELTYLLVTDTYATVRPVIDRLRRQTMPAAIEIVLVAPTRESILDLFAHQSEFGALILLEHPIADLGAARAVGIAAASAPTVFIGETHSYPHPDLVALLLAARARGYACAAPGMGNANPRTARSWAGFLSDYGRWSATLPAGEIPHFPIYNAAFDRSALLALGDRLGPALSHGDELQLRLEGAGHRTYFEPAARLDHVNVAPTGHWVYERFLSGLLIAHHRSLRWALPRRLFYALCSPAIPIVLILRVIPGVRAVLRHQSVPAGTIPLIFLGFFIKGFGEFLGYLGWPAQAAEASMQEYEVHKLAYAGPGKGA